MRGGAPKRVEQQASKQALRCTALHCGPLFLFPPQETEMCCAAVRVTGFLAWLVMTSRQYSTPVWFVRLATAQSSQPVAARKCNQCLSGWLCCDCCLLLLLLSLLLVVRMRMTKRGAVLLLVCLLAFSLARALSPPWTVRCGAVRLRSCV